MPSLHTHSNTDDCFNVLENAKLLFLVNKIEGIKVSILI